MSDNELNKDSCKAVRGYCIEDLHKDQQSCFSKTVTETDISLFIAVSGDTNPVHIDEDYAQATQFKGRIAHGMLGASFISTVLGTQLPGPGAIYLSQTLQFKRPVRIGDTVTAKVTVKDINRDKNIVTLSCVCLVNAKIVISGEASVLVSSRQL